MRAAGGGRGCPAVWGGGGGGRRNRAGGWQLDDALVLAAHAVQQNVLAGRVRRKAMEGDGGGDLRKEVKIGRMEEAWLRAHADTSSRAYHEHTQNKRSSTVPGWKRRRRRRRRAWNVGLDISTDSRAAHLGSLGAPNARQTRGARAEERPRGPKEERSTPLPRLPACPIRLCISLSIVADLSTGTYLGTLLLDLLVYSHPADQNQNTSVVAGAQDQLESTPLSSSSSSLTLRRAMRGMARCRVCIILL